MSGRPVVPGPDTLILGIETSCDETAAALVMGGTDVVSSVVSTQIDLHAQLLAGGVTSEMARRWLLLLPPSWLLQGLPLLLQPWWLHRGLPVASLLVP